MIKSWCCVYLFIAIHLHHASAANILIAFDLPSPSHEIWNYALAEGLIEKGHNVTMLGPYTNRGKNTESYHKIKFDGVAEIMLAMLSEFSIEDNMSKMDALTGMKMFFDFSYETCRITYDSNGFKAIMAYPGDFKFDLIIIDVTMGSCLYPFIQRFNYPPTVAVTPFLLPPAHSNNFGNDIQPAYVPFFQLTYTQDMTFYQRVINYLLTLLDVYGERYYVNHNLDQLAKKAFGENVASMLDLERHISLLLCNLNHALHNPQPLTPNIIPVGGLHAKPAKKLPKDLQQMMDNAKDGVVLFCLGTNSRSDKLKLETRGALIKALGKLKQEVIWKYESDIADLPKNVHVRKWLPQNDIMGHPNLRLFLSHGGALSTLEAAYHGVPVVGLPFFIDQKTTINSMVERKLALKLDLDNITWQGVLGTVNQILDNPVYDKNMKEVSRRMKEQPITPLETAVFWSEFAMRHNGTHYLNPKSRDMSLFVSSSTDVKLFLLFVVFAVIYCCCKIYSLIRGTVSKGKKKVKVN